MLLELLRFREAVISCSMCFRYPFDVFKCGKCPECLQDKRREWSIRLQLHTFYSGIRPFYAHLTYDNKHVPTNEYGNLTLSKDDVQKFLKRLRHQVPQGFKYYIAGEYGPNGTHRPHYHCVLFGFDSSLQESEVISILQKAWKNGQVRKTSCWLRDYGQLHYVTKYLINYFNEDFSKKQAPFRLCSSGFGSPFIRFARDTNLFREDIQRLFRCDYGLRSDGKKFPIRWHGEAPYYCVENGEIEFNPLLTNFRDFIEFAEFSKGRMKVHRYPLPRYFQQKLYTEDFRTALGELKKFRIADKNCAYHLLYMDYDKQCEVPMWLQLKRYDWEKVKKNKKDKNLKVDYNKILND